MNEWLICAAILAVALVVCAGACVFLSPMNGVVVLEVGGTLTTTVLLLLSEGFHRQAFVDLALVFAAMSLAGALAFVRLLERQV